MHWTSKYDRIQCTIAAFAILWSGASNVWAASYDWATIGDPGNSADPRTGVGAVDYSFRLSKHEVTNSQYVEFLNAVAQDDTFGLYRETESSSTWYGIARTGSPGSYAYSVKPTVIGQGLAGQDYTYADKPVSNVSFFDAIRFVNWLENGQPTGPQGLDTTESGAYLLSEGDSVVRTLGASYFLPSEDEWYKAAYYNPAVGQYYSYPTSSDTAPDDPPGGAPRDSADPTNVANYGIISGLYPKTDVGFFNQTISPYGILDMAGNVAEWNDTQVLGTSRGIRGGSWADTSPSFMLFNSPQSGPTGIAYTGTGFRVGTSAVPEPASFVLTLVGLAIVQLRRKRTL